MERDVSIITDAGWRTPRTARGTRSMSLDVEESTTERLMEIEPDAAFICLHGVGRRDVTVQALLETLGIPTPQRAALFRSCCMDRTTPSGATGRRHPTPAFIPSYAGHARMGRRRR